MSNMSDNYEVGYGKPPKNTQFRKGVSGNPNGRPKKAHDFDHVLLREAKSLITINENGRRRRISKHVAVIKQMMNNAMKGSTSGLRMYRDAYRQAFERVALLEAQEPDNIGTMDPNVLTDEQLAWIIAQDLKKMEQEIAKEEVTSSAANAAVRTK